MGKHIDGCQCSFCKGMRGELRGSNNPNFKGNKTKSDEYFRYSKNNHCIDCGKLISNNALRCGSCESKNKWKIGIVAQPNFKHGNACQDRKCLTCGSQITPGSKNGRCSSCSKIGELNPAIKGNRDFNKENNPNWQGGIDIDGYSFEFDTDLKDSIRTRDNFECQNCGMTEEEHLTVWGTVLNIHHIDYNKKNCEEINLITTCKQCNIRANTNRDYWKDYYKQKILLKGNKING